jgi:HEAT repeat protein
MLGRALEISHGEVVHIIAELSRIDSEQALALIRRAVRAKRESLRDHAASAIIHVQYGDDAELALQDEEELVRHVAVKQLEKQENATALIAALRNDSTGVRRVAAWYMGRKGVNQATDVLIEQVQGENDIEALRAAIWSLGMLHDTRAVPYLRKLSKHPNRLIATTAQESASRLGK